MDYLKVTAILVVMFLVGVQYHKIGTEQYMDVFEETHRKYNSKTFRDLAIGCRDLLADEMYRVKQCTKKFRALHSEYKTKTNCI